MFEYKQIVPEKIKAANTDGLDGLLIKADAAKRSDNQRLALDIAKKLQSDFGDRVDAILHTAELYRQFVGRDRATFRSGRPHSLITMD